MVYLDYKQYQEQSIFGNAFFLGGGGGGEENFGGMQKMVTTSKKRQFGVCS